VVTDRDARSGYRVERIYVGSQEYRLVEPDSSREQVDADDRQVEFGWDWRPIGTRKFEVVIDLEVESTKQASEEAKVRIIGVFEASESPSIKFLDFVRNNAAAILFPFAREVVSTMTGRGPFGAFHVYPLNIVALLKDVKWEETTGWKYLSEHPDIAATFGMEYRREEQSQSQPTG
jgi:preprotein translocase subunit SecB